MTQISEEHLFMYCTCDPNDGAGEPQVFTLIPDSEEIDAGRGNAYRDNLLRVSALYVCEDCGKVFKHTAFYEEVDCRFTTE